MKRIAVITQGVKLHNEKGYTRFAYIAEILSKNGYEVELITSTFQHWEKKQRDIAGFKQDSNYKVQFIYEPGYKKNIDFRRLRSHHVLAVNLKNYLEEHHYDLLYFEIPPNDVAKVIVDHARKKGIPVIADVNDLWPEAMFMVLDVPIISSLLFWPLKRDAEYVYRYIDGVVGTSEEYTLRPQKYNKRKIHKTTVYVGNDMDEFDFGIQQYSKLINKQNDEFWVMYAGTIGTSYDIKTLILAAQRLKTEGYESIKIKILGTGPLKEKMEQLAGSLDCEVEFLGYQPYKMMAAYLSKADILINSFVKKAPQSIVTKTGDYLASGKAMINTCSSPEFRKKVEQNHFGINIEAEDEEALSNTILWLKNNRETRECMGINARKVAEKEFDRKKSYTKIIHLIKENLEAKEENVK